MRTVLPWEITSHRQVSPAIVHAHCERPVKCVLPSKVTNHSQQYPFLHTMMDLRNGIASRGLQWMSCSGELRTQKLKSHLVRTQSLNVLPLKPGIGQYIAIYATLTARDFFLAYFYPSGPFTCIFFPKSLLISPVLTVANTWFLCRPTE